MNSKIYALVCFFVANFALISSGCNWYSDAPPRSIISGTVTFDGVPVENGEIKVIPAEDSNLPLALALITDGKFVLDNKGGAPVGTHRVEIRAFRKLDKKSSGGAAPGEEEVEQYIPVKYNVQSELTVTIEDARSIPPFAFELTSK